MDVRVVAQGDRGEDEGGLCARASGEGGEVKWAGGASVHIGRTRTRAPDGVGACMHVRVE